MRGFMTVEFFWKVLIIVQIKELKEKRTSFYIC